MRYDDRLIDDLKARVSLSDLIGKTVALKRQGNEMAGLSPFSKEKTPSFYVVDPKQMYFCHSTGKSGDALTWLMETERLTFPEAVRRLAEITGTPLPETPAAETGDGDREAIFGALAAAEAWFSSALTQDNAEAEGWRAYLDGRGVTAADIELFGIGIAPADGQSLTKALGEKGYSVQTLVKSGLLCEMPGKGATYSRFRGRVTFPIRDARGRVVSFGGRVRENVAGKPKYLNGPETIVFSKNRQWFGLPEALKGLVASKGSGDLLVVEGYLDVVAAQRAGVPAVAGMGTNLSIEKLDVLWRRGLGIQFCFDADAAGTRAARGTIELLLPGLAPERCPRFVLLRGAKDADELVKSAGSQALKAAIDQAVPLLEMLIISETFGQTYETPDRRVLLKRKLLAAVDKIQDRELAAAFSEDLALRLQEFLERAKSVDLPPATDQSAPPEVSAKAVEDVIAPPRPENVQTVKNKTAVPVVGLPALASSLVVAGMANPGWMLAMVPVIRNGAFGSERFAQFSEDLATFLDQIPADPDWGKLPSLTGYLDELGYGGLLAGAAAAAAGIQTPYHGSGLRKEYASRAWSATLEAAGRVYELDHQYDFNDPEVASELGTDAFMRLRSERSGLAASLRSGFLWQEVEFEYQEALERSDGETQ